MPLQFCVFGHPFICIFHENKWCTFARRMHNQTLKMSSLHSRNDITYCKLLKYGVNIIKCNYRPG